jgi:hypothetical protein
VSTVTEPSAVWAYAVAEHIRPVRLAGLAGVGGGRVRAVAAAGLTAIAGDVPLSGFSEAALRRNLEDLAWLEATARAHHRVIEAVAGDGPVVPMRLATVYRDDASATAALAEFGGEFRAALDRTRAHKEWGIKAYAARPAEPGGADGDPGPADPGPADAGAGRASAGSGAAYLARRRQELSAHERARRDVVAGAELVHARLANLADQSRLHPPQSPRLTGRRAQMILNAAYLLPDERDGELATAVSELAGQHPELRIEITGPWPPYSFAGLPEAGQPEAGQP